MEKLFNIFILAICIILTSLNSCQKDEVQNLDINVSGKVTDQNNFGIENVTIYIERGKTGNYSPTVYQQFQSVSTNSSGNYNYLVKNDTYTYKICCGIPTGFTSVEESCKQVNHSIINSKTLPNIIDFKIKQ